jgi:ABC-type Co2+ transport system permease subunit
VQHGPVGVRCLECLQPARAAILECAPPQRLGQALAAGAGMAVCWTVLFIELGIRLSAQAADLPLDPLLAVIPNLLLSGLAGGLVGWVIWRVCGRTYSRVTIGCALGFAAAVPLLTALVLAGYLHAESLLDGDFALRLLAAILASAVFALLLSTQLHRGE